LPSRQEIPRDVPEERMDVFSLGAREEEDGMRSISAYEDALNLEERSNIPFEHGPMAEGELVESTVAAHSLSLF
jgi:hypothetical protein